MTAPYYEQDGVSIFCGKAEDVLPSLDAVGVVATDPPYGTGGWRRTGSGNGSNPAGTLVREAWDDGATDWLGKLPPLEAVMTFWPAGYAKHLLTAADGLGLTKHRAIYMRKLDPKPQVDGRTRFSIEPIWVLSRDGFLLYGGDDVVECSTPRLGRDAGATGHPYEKPLAAMTWLLSKTDLSPVLDPYMGTGTTLVAAKLLGRRAIGIEKEERWCEVAAKRLAQGVLWPAGTEVA